MSDAPSPVSGPRPALDDLELLAAIARGDASAASALYLRARGPIDRTILRLLHRRDPDHDDLVQLSMIELVGSLERFRGECSLDTWISRITAHAVYKELRRRRAGGRLLADVAAIEASAPRTVDFGRQVVLRSLVGRVKRHLDTLDPDKAWTLLLHDVCGYDLKEIAEITEVSVAAAQSRLVRGRGELQARLQSDPELRDSLEEGEDVG